MKALIMEEYREFRYADVPTPVPGDAEVLIRVMACAVCGSDVHGMDGSTGRRKPPIIMGHEAAGVIEQCGAAVTRYSKGDRVTFDSTIYCNACDACREGNFNLCGNRRVLGVSCDDYRMHGAFAEYVVVPEHILYPLPENVSFVQAAMVEPLAVAYHAATRTPPAGKVLVVGAGTIGILLIQVLKSLGVESVIAADIDDKRLISARGVGADFCVNPLNEKCLSEIVSLTGGRGVDIAYDATGTAATVDLCLKSARLAGRIVLVGNLAQEVAFPLQWVVTRQQTVFGSCASAGEYRECLDLISAGKVDVDMLISRVVPLAEGNEWLQRIYNKEPGLYKLVFVS